MFGKIIGALIGAEVEKQRRQSGLKGAVIGAAAVSIMRRMGPLGMAIGGAYALKKMADRRRENRTG